MKHAALLALALVALVALGACDPGSAAPVPRPSPPRDAAAAPGATHGGRDEAAPAAPALANVGQLPGKPLYLALCSPCHGADAKGYAADHAPSLVNPTFLESASDELLRRSIIAGRPGTSMAAYGAVSGGPLDDAAVDRLVAYLRAQGPAAKRLAAPAAGRVASGARLYAKHCLACHGDAKTRGEAVWLANPEFQAAASDAFLHHAIARGRPGTPMEAFAGKLSRAELADLVSYVRVLGKRAPAPASMLPAPTGDEAVVLNPSGKSPRFQLRAEPCPPGAPRACKPDPRFVSVDQVARAMAAKQRMVIVDARPPSEWRRVHITGAVSIPYHDLARLSELPKDGTWIIAYCACPHHLSGIVVDELRKRGYTHAVVLDEGINEWHRRGLPVTAAEGVPKPVPEPKPPAGTIF